MPAWYVMTVIAGAAALFLAFKLVEAIL